MSDTRIYHNPRCSKSRQTLALLQENNIEPEIVLYLKTPPTLDELRALLSLLELSPRELIRKNEAIYKTLQLANHELSDQTLIEAMCEHPKLIERPIVIHGNKAKLGRPPEAVLALFHD